MTSTITMEKVARPELAKHESSILDLVFVMDCTGSMGSYIASATNNIRSIVEEIVVSEKSDIRLALVEYRDHPPQDHTFVTRVHDFTAKFSEMKSWLQECQASGGGDGPEAVADGLHAVLKLSWRAESTKICILIADAPPHGLDPSGDGFPNGCPDGLDPVQIVREMAKKHITLYSVGVEPPIMPYRDFFMSLAYTTGGQYVPMINAKLLAKVIIGGVREEISLDRLMQAAEEDINREMKRAEAEGADDKEKVKRINDIFTTNNLFSTQMANPFGVTSCTAKVYSSTCQNMAEMQHAFVSAPRATSSVFATTSIAPFTFGPPSTASNPFGSGISSAVAPAAGSTAFTFGTSSTTAPQPSSFTFGPPSAAPGLFGSSTSSAAAPAVGPTGFTFGTSSTTASQPTSFTFGSPSAASTVSTFGTSSTAAPQPTSFTFGPPSAASTASTFGTSSTAAPQTASFGFAPSTVSFGVDSAASTAGAEADMTYDVTENAAVNEDQAERIYQKWQHRKK